MTVILEESFVLKTILLAMSKNGYDYQSLTSKIHDSNHYEVCKDGLTLFIAKISTSKVQDPILIYLDPINIRSEAMLSIANSVDLILEDKAIIHLC